MNREDIIKLAREAGFVIDEASRQHQPNCIGFTHYLIDDELSRFAELVAAAEREACAKVCEEKQEHLMPIPCPDGISGCLVAHYVPARREKTGNECAAAIRARGETK